MTDEQMRDLVRRVERLERGVHQSDVVIAGTGVSGRAAFGFKVTPGGDPDRESMPQIVWDNTGLTGPPRFVFTSDGETEISTGPTVMYDVDLTLTAIDATHYGVTDRVTGAPLRLSLPTIVLVVRGLIWRPSAAAGTLDAGDFRYTTSADGDVLEVSEAILNADIWIWRAELL